MSGRNPDTAKNRDSLIMSALAPDWSKRLTVALFATTRGLSRLEAENLDTLHKRPGAAAWKESPWSCFRHGKL